MELEAFSTILCSPRHCIRITRNVNWCSYTNIHSEKYIESFIAQLYTYSTIRENTIVAILHNYGAKTIFYYFVITKELNLSYVKYIVPYLYQYSPRKISKALWENYIYTLQFERKILWQFFIYMELDPFFYYFLFTKTLNLSHNK